MKKVVGRILTGALLLAIGAYAGRIVTIYTAVPVIISDHEVYIDYGTRTDSYYVE